MVQGRKYTKTATSVSGFVDKKKYGISRTPNQNLRFSKQRRAYEHRRGRRASIRTLVGLVSRCVPLAGDWGIVHHQATSEAAWAVCGRSPAVGKKYPEP